MNAPTRIDERWEIADDGERIRVYVLHPNADKMLEGEIKAGYTISDDRLTSWGNRFATFFNQVYTALYPCTFGVMDVYDEWELEAIAIARRLQHSKEVTPKTLQQAFDEVFTLYFDESEITYKDRTAFFAYAAKTWNQRYC